jgi:hypothetical protein
MIRQVMEGAGLTFWPVLSFLIFLASCAGMLLWLYRPGSAPVYRRMAGMALDRGESGDGGAAGRDGGMEGK